MKYYVTSDVHSFYTQFRAALEQAGYFTDEEPHKLLICGDLFDRGTEAVQMQEFILALMERGEVILVKGNHEDLFCDLVTRDHGLPYGHHVSNGTFLTAIYLTGMELPETEEDCQHIADAGRETPYYRRIIPAMLNYFETERYVFVHGWVPCDVRADEDGTARFIVREHWRDDTEDWVGARWINGMEAARQGALVEGKTVVCGHFHASYGHAVIEGKGSEYDSDADHSPYSAEGIIALDACTAHSGMVNVIVLEDEPVTP